MSTINATNSNIPKPGVQNQQQIYADQEHAPKMPGAVPVAHDQIDSGKLQLDMQAAKIPDSIDVTDFFNLPTDELMARLRSGKVPSKLFDSQEGILRLQGIVQHASEMNTIMTQLRQALHQMNMAIVQNLRA